VFAQGLGEADTGGNGMGYLRYLARSRTWMILATVSALVCGVALVLYVTGPSTMDVLTASYASERDLEVAWTTHIRLLSVVIDSLVGTVVCQLIGLLLAGVEELRK
jgi:hypothetical protein